MRSQLQLLALQNQVRAHLILPQIALHEKEDQIFQKETLKIEDNHKIFYQAKDRTIVFKEGRVGRVEVNRDEFIIQCKKIDPMSAKKQLEGYLIDKATKYIIPRAKGLAAHLGVEEKISEIKLRKTKSKWGHCTSKGVVQFNWLIMLAPNSIICLLYTSPSPRDRQKSRMPSSA